MSHDFLMHDLTAFQRDILVVVFKHKSSPGPVIRDEIENFYEAELNPGRLYPSLNELVNKGLILKRDTDARENIYTVTSRGEREIEDYIKWVKKHTEVNEITAD